MGFLAPVDLAIGWNQMALAASTNSLTVGQRGRWYYVHWQHGATPLPPRKIMLYSANMHMIPSSPEVARRLMAVREGQYVRVAGWLVNVAGEGGAYWTTSLRRDDTGAGACEIVYVCDVSEIRWP